MNNVEIQILDAPSLRHPILVCGLPDSGMVAKLAIDHLIRQLKPKLLAQVYSPHLPAQVNIRSDMTIDLVKNEVYCWRNVDSGSDLLIYTGDSQPTSPSGAYEIANAVLDFARKLGVKRIYVLAAFVREETVKNPKVHLAATSAALIKEFAKEDTFEVGEGSITWMHGLLLGLAKGKDLEALCVSGETEGSTPDPQAASAVLEILSSRLGLEVHPTDLLERYSVVYQQEEGETDGRDRRESKDEGRDLGYIT